MEYNSISNANLRNFSNISKIDIIGLRPTSFPPLPYLRTSFIGCGRHRAVLPLPVVAAVKKNFFQLPANFMEGHLHPKDESVNHPDESTRYWSIPQFRVPLEPTHYHHFLQIDFDGVCGQQSTEWRPMKVYIWWWIEAVEENFWSGRVLMWIFVVQINNNNNSIGGSDVPEWCFYGIFPLLVANNSISNNYVGGSAAAAAFCPILFIYYDAMFAGLPTNHRDEKEFWRLPL